MPSDQPRGPGRSWRQGSPGESKFDARRAWQKDAARAGPTLGWNRATKFGAAALAFAACVVGVIVLIYMLRKPRVAYLVLSGASYRDVFALPHNAYGWQGLEDIAKWAGGSGPATVWGSGLPRLSQASPQEFSAFAWDRDLDNRFSEKTIIIDLALHGAADTKGPYLFRGDPEGKEIVRLTDLLDHLKELDPDKKKLLILDATQPRANWPLGILDNEFALELAKMEDKIKAVPNLVVLVSSSPDEQSWVSEEWRQTIFGHYVLEGLRGGADLDRDDHVNAWELYQYVQKNVQDWVYANRTATQRPMLLPLDGGAELAKRMDLVVITEPYKPAEAKDAPGNTFTFPPELDKAWKRCQELRDQTPSPAVYSPHLWRRYQDVVLRFEQLLRAGALSEPESWRKTWLDGLEDKINQARTLTVKGSEINSLPMPAALGLAVSNLEKDLDSKFLVLWNAPAAKRDAAWTDMQTWARQAGADNWLLLRVTSLLLKRIEEPGRRENADENLEKARALIGTVTQGKNDRPIEAHYLAMLKDLPSDKDHRAPIADIQTALKTRRLAEETALSAKDVGSGQRVYPYSEQVLPWIRENVDKADHERRLGEDLLFATDAKAWEKARGQFKKATVLYHKANDDAAVVRFALGVRDQVSADLPYYSHWLAGRRLVNDGQIRDVGDLVQKAKLLWEETHALAARLEKPTSQWLTETPPADSPTQSRSLKGHAQDIDTEFKRLCDKFRIECQNSDSRLPTVWHEIESVLTVPLIDLSIRRSLLTNSREITRDINDHFQPTGQVAPEAEIKQQQDAAQIYAAEQAKMALAMLGKRVVDERGAGWRDSEAIKQLLVNKSIREAGEQIGLCWRGLLTDINDKTSGSLALDLSAALGQLGMAERLGRLLDGASADRVKQNPAEEARRSRTHGLLLWQAARTIDDHWFSQEPRMTPYFQAAAGKYVTDARAMLEGKGAEAGGSQKDIRMKDVLAIRNRLEQRGELHLRVDLKGRDHLDVTSEREFPVDYKLEGDKAVPSGYPVVWINPLASALKLAASEDPKRLDCREWPKFPADNPIRYRLSPNVPAPRVPKPVETGTTLAGRFRGQVLDQETPIHLHLLPHIQAKEMPFPPRGGIAIRADDEYHKKFAANNSALVIIMDCSGSMNEKSPAGKTRFEEATQALGDVMKVIERGTKVSLWVYAQKEDRFADEDDVEKTIRRFKGPVTWDPGDQGQIKDFMEVKNLEPWGLTPLVRSMVEARADFQNVNGHKVMLILTDGMDTRFEKRSYPKEIGAKPSTGDAKLNPDGTEKIPKFLPGVFKDTGIELKIVGFQLETIEKKEAEGQFLKALENLEPPGKFYTADKTEDLKRRLQEALKPMLRCRLEKIKGQLAAGIPKDGLPITRGTQNYQWFLNLEPGIYRLRLHNEEPQEVEIAAGDLLMVTLTGKGAFQRALYGKYRENAPKPQESKDKWLLAVPQNQLKVDNWRQEMLVTLENDADLAPQEGGILKQIKPQFVWFSMETPGAAAPVGLHWENAIGYPAPSWSMGVSEWPHPNDEPAKPVLKAWWRADQSPSVAATVTRDLAINLDGDFKRPLTVAGDEVFIESIKVEDHEIRPGVTKPCLVARCRYAKNKPVIMQLSGLAIDGREHRLYSLADSYTGYFWPVSKNQAEKTPFRLEVISLDNFKKEAAMNELKLGPPDLKDERPLAIDLMKN